MKIEVVRESHNKDIPLELIAWPGIGILNSCASHIRKKVTIINKLKLPRFHTISNGNLTKNT